MRPQTPLPASQRLPLATAARLYGVHPETLRRRIKRGEMQGGRDNRGRFFVEMSAEEVAAARPQQEPHVSATVTTDVAARDALVHALEAQVRDLQAERDRLLTIVSQAQEALARRNQGMFFKIWDRLFGAGK